MMAGISETDIATTLQSFLSQNAAAFHKTKCIWIALRSRIKVLAIHPHTPTYCHHSVAYYTTTRARVPAATDFNEVARQISSQGEKRSKPVRALEEILLISCSIACLLPQAPSYAWQYATLLMTARGLSPYCTLCRAQRRDKPIERGVVRVPDKVPPYFGRL